MAFLRLAALVGLLLAVCEAYSGEGTSYSVNGGRGQGHCAVGGNLGHWENYYASLGGSGFDLGNCRKCIRITGSRGSVVAMVLDSCPSCRKGDVDMSPQALYEATGYRADRKNVNWNFVSCGGGDDSSSTRSASRSRGRKKCPKGRKGRKCRKAQRGRKMLDIAAEA